MEEDWLGVPFSLAGKRIWVAGHRGMVGSAVLRHLSSENCELLTTDFDLRVQADVARWMKDKKPDVVIIAAARAGGILANATRPAEFLYDNMAIQNSIIVEAHESRVKRLLFLGSSCIYPKDAVQPLKEESLLSGVLEQTNEAYAVAKIAGIKLCEAYRKQYGDDFISVMPCNLYGPGDKFHEQDSHVIPALMMKAHKAKIAGRSLEVWGSGTPRREFLYVDDLAEALIFALKNYSSARSLNIGAGEDMTIAELAGEIAAAVGFRGQIVYDRLKPDGTPRKLMDSSRIFSVGWRPRTDLKTGLRLTYEWYISHAGLRDAA